MWQEKHVYDCWNWKVDIQYNRVQAYAHVMKTAGHKQETRNCQRYHVATDQFDPHTAWMIWLRHSMYVVLTEQIYIDHPAFKICSLRNSLSLHIKYHNLPLQNQNIWPPRHMLTIRLLLQQFHYQCQGILLHINKQNHEVHQGYRHWHLQRGWGLDKNFENEELLVLHCGCKRHRKPEVLLIPQWSSTDDMAVLKVCKHNNKCNYIKYSIKLRSKRLWTCN
jgi:hypothetical protein